MPRKRSETKESPVCLRRCTNGSVLLAVHVQPKASRDGVCGQHGDSLKVAITSPPVDGKANIYLTRYLAELFGVARRDVTLQSGQTSRKKTFRISGKPVEELIDRLQELLD